MSTLISPSGLMQIADAHGLTYASLIAGVDPANQNAAALVATLQTIFAADIPQFVEWYPAVLGVYTTPSNAVGANPLFGAGIGFGGGNAASGSGIVNRASLVTTALFRALDGMRQKLLKYGAAVDPSIVDLASYAAWYNSGNGLAEPYTALFSYHFAALYWYVYGQSTQLPPSSVFSPAGIALATATITGVNTASHVFDVWPSVNGYTSPAPGTDAWGNALYLGGMPMAQAFAPIKQTVAHITTNINGTCALTVTAPNQAGVSKAWTATLDNLNVGHADVVLTPATGGDRIGGSITAIAVAGTATAGAFSLNTGAEERSGT